MADRLSEVSGFRNAEYGVDNQFLNRWSSRAFLDKPVEEEQLRCVLEAARWSPSCFNEQPWRFLVARHKAALEKMQACLAESNQIWANHAPVLIAVLAHKEFKQSGKPNRWHQFDTGAAWAYLAMQAYLIGMTAHAMGGFQTEKLRESFQVPQTLEIMAVIALGYRGDAKMLPEAIRDREVPTDRQPLQEIWYADKL